MKKILTSLLLSGLTLLSASEKIEGSYACISETPQPYKVKMTIYDYDYNVWFDQRNFVNEMQNKGYFDSYPSVMSYVLHHNDGYMLYMSGLKNGKSKKLKTAFVKKQEKTGYLQVQFFSPKNQKPALVKFLCDDIQNEKKLEYLAHEHYMKNGLYKEEKIVKQEITPKNKIEKNTIKISKEQMYEEQKLNSENSFASMYKNNIESKVIVPLSEKRKLENKQEKLSQREIIKQKLLAQQAKDKVIEEKKKQLLKQKALQQAKQLEQQKLEEQKKLKEQARLAKLEQQRLEQERLKKEEELKEKARLAKLEQERLEKQRLEEEKYEKLKEQLARISQTKYKMVTLEAEQKRQQELLEKQKEEEKLAKLKKEEEKRAYEAKIEELKRLKQINIKRLEEEKLARIKAQKLQKELEEQKEKNRLAKIEEQRLAKLKEQKEQARLAKLKEEERIRNEKRFKLSEEQVKKLKEKFDSLQKLSFDIKNTKVSAKDLIEDMESNKKVIKKLENQVNNQANNSSSNVKLKVKLTKEQKLELIRKLGELK